MIPSYAGGYTESYMITVIPSVYFDFLYFWCLSLNQKISISSSMRIFSIIWLFVSSAEI